MGGITDAGHLQGLVRQGNLLHRHLVAGQGSGLIAADHGDGAQGLDGGQAAHDGIALGHALHPDGQSDGDDGR